MVQQQKETPPAKENISIEKNETEEKSKNLDEYDLEKFDDALEFIKSYKADQKSWRLAVEANIKRLAKHHKVENYFWIFLYDGSNSISVTHSNRIYETIKSVNGSDIAMLLYSSGGSIEPAYLISKTCKRKSKTKFVVSIPRKAKSAATLIALGANEIHMGMMSELGPIDPQIGDFPALSTSNALEKIAEMAAKYPAASDMFSKYLNANLDLRVLGYFERINESAVQYAERLLEGKKINPEKSISQISDYLVNHYKDHSFVIDYEEAKSILGPEIVKEETAEYKFTNDVYQMLDRLTWMVSFIHKKEMTFIGNMSDGLTFTDQKDD
jgi:ClpP class serine protease